MPRILILIFALFHLPQVVAGTVSYRFDGTINKVAQYDCVRAATGDCIDIIEDELTESTEYPEHTFRVGDPFSIVASWDSDAGPPVLLESDTAVYLDETVSITVSSTGFFLPSPAFAPATGGFAQQVRVTNGAAPTSDAFVVAQSFSQSAPLDGRILAPNAILGLVDSSGTALDSLDIPTMIDLDDFDSPTAAVSFIEIFDDGFRPTLLVTASLEGATVVPVPTGAWLLGSALGILGWLKRRTAQVHR